MPQGELDLDLAVMRLAWRLDALDEWRRDVVEPAIATTAQLAQADAIAAAVTEAIRGERRLALTGLQKLVGCIGVAAAVADVLLRATGHGG